jgi:nitrogen regulatory protein P-II 1
MRRVEVLLPPTKLAEIRDALADLGVENMALGEVKVVEPTARRHQVYRGSDYVVDFSLKIKMELVVEDDLVPGILAVVRTSLGLDEAETATVLLSEHVEVVRVGIGAQGEAPRRRASASPRSEAPSTIR